MESGAFNGSYDFSSRFKGGSGTNPEEFDAAPHAGCFSMALATRAHQRRTPAEPRHDDRESSTSRRRRALSRFR
jgi:osmotically inducible protein OsmC